jgi:hypothetical protein
MDWIYTGKMAGFLPANMATRIRAIESEQEEKRSGKRA